MIRSLMKQEVKANYKLYVIVTVQHPLFKDNIWVA